MKAFLPHVLAALVFAAGGIAHAGEIADAGALADTQTEQGHYIEALATLGRAEDNVWRRSPLLFGKTVFVASNPTGYGIYDLHDGSTFKRTESVILYAEPIGYGYRKDGEINIIDLSLNFEVRTKDGRLIGGQKDFANPQLRSRVENREFFIKVVYDFSAVPAGDYQVTTTVNDKTSGKSGSFAMPFTLVE